MTLRLDPRLPLVWRSPFSLQIGIDPVIVRIDDVTEPQERMLAALAVGVSFSGLAVVAGGRTTDADWDRDHLLALVKPALETSTSQTLGCIALSGSTTLVTAIADLLADRGAEVLVAADITDLADTRPDIAVVVGHFVLAPRVHGVWLRRDIPHLSVIIGDTANIVGPMVEPGSGPCLLCLELHRRDDDSAWPAIATQLLGRRSGAESALLTSETAAAAARMVIERLRSPERRGAASMRIDGTTGERQWRQWQVHSECGCGGIPNLEEAMPRSNSRTLRPVLPGTGSANVALLAPAGGSSTS